MDKPFKLGSGRASTRPLKRLLGPLSIVLVFSALTDSAQANHVFGHVVLRPDTVFTIQFAAVEWIHPSSYRTLMTDTINRIKTDAPQAQILQRDLGTFRRTTDIPFETYNQLILALVLKTGVDTNERNFLVVYTTEFLEDVQFHGAGGVTKLNQKSAIVVGNSIMSVSLPRDQILIASVHEAGHLFGFDHETTPGCIMNESITTITIHSSLRKCQAFPTSLFPISQPPVPPPSTTANPTSFGLVAGIVAGFGSIVVVGIILAAVLITRDRGPRPLFMNPAMFQPNLQGRFQLRPRQVLWVNGQPIPIY